jgi:hypothetical protein
MSYDSCVETEGALAAESRDKDYSRYNAGCRD